MSDSAKAFAVRPADGTASYVEAAFMILSWRTVDEHSNEIRIIRCKLDPRKEYVEDGECEQQNKNMDLSQHRIRD